MSKTDNWTRENLAWLAGLLEGEGSFIQCRGRNMQVRAAMCDEDVLRKAYDIAGVGGVYGPYKKKNPKGGYYKDQWQFVVQNQYDAYALSVALYQWLGERRREQVRLALIRWKEWQAERHHRMYVAPKIRVTPQIRAEILAEYNGRRFRRGQAAALAKKYGLHPNTLSKVVRDGYEQIYHH